MIGLCKSKKRRTQRLLTAGGGSSDRYSRRLGYNLKLTETAQQNLQTVPEQLMIISECNSYFIHFAFNS